MTRKAMLVLASILMLPAYLQAEETLQYNFLENRTGEDKFSMCRVCHDLSTPSKEDASPYPSLVGMDKAYIETQLINYREGRLSDPTMNAMSSALSDQDIQSLATYIASRNPK